MRVIWLGRSGYNSLVGAVTQGGELDLSKEQIQNLGDQVRVKPKKKEVKK